MRRFAFAFFGIAGVALATRCAAPTPPCQPIAAMDGLQVDDAVVWGFADLHAHPAIERAFSGRLIWGSAMDDAPVDGSQLPMIASCPVETHDTNASSPIDHAVGNEVYPKLAQSSGFAHGPVGAAGGAWPNARDLIHQQMNVASIRRAYEGGLRLMFASTTDDQVFTALLKGPNVVNGFVPDSEADYESARAQLDLIETIANANSDWMAIAATPKAARDIIGAGKLALVLSLEMEGLSEDDVIRLQYEYPIAHIVPIHLIDNDVGGTAVNGPLFNSASALVSSLYRSDKVANHFMDLSATPRYPRPLDWPQQIATLETFPVYAQISPIPLSEYAPDYCYDSIAACSQPVAAPLTTWVELGQENARGLCTKVEECEQHVLPGVDRIHRLLDRGLIVDLSHMGRRSVRDTLDHFSGRTFVASHGDVVHFCEGGARACAIHDHTTFQPSSERSLEADAARALIDSHGVLGLGTSIQNYAMRSVVAARGGPVLRLDPSQPAACLAKLDASGSSGACDPAPNVVKDASPKISRLVVTTNGGVTSPAANRQPFVRVEMRSEVSAVDRFRRRAYIVPMTCSDHACSASVDLGARDRDSGDPPSDTSIRVAPPCDARSCETAETCGTTSYTVDDIESVTLEWQFLAGSSDYDQCQSSANESTSTWTVEQVTITADGVSAPIASLGPRANAPIAMLSGHRGTFDVYERHDRPETAPRWMTGNLLRVAMTMSPSTKLEGASPAQGGANVCYAFREWRGETCASVATPIPAGVTECPSDGAWWNLNQRGEWADGVLLYSFARHAGDESSICGLDVSIRDWRSGAAPIEIDGVFIDAIEDPLGHFVRRYADVSREVAHGELGKLALGTDFNGLNGLMDISEFGPQLEAPLPSSCSLTGDAAPPALAPMRYRNADGSLGAPIRIDERGLATYGMLADMVATIRDYPGCGQDVYDSLMLSAEATLRMWEWIVDPETAMKRGPLPSAKFECAIRGVP